MSESNGQPIQFFATAETVGGGGDDVRMELRVQRTPPDYAAAMSLFGKRGRVLLVKAYPGAQPNAVAEFHATIPQIQSGIRFPRKAAPLIKLDIPATDVTQALRVVGYEDAEVLRFEIADEGAKPTKQKAPAKTKGEHGAFWAELHKAGFHYRDAVRAWLGLPQKTMLDDRLIAAAYYGHFRVESRSEIAPERLIEAMDAVKDQFGLDGAITFCEQAKARVGNG